MGNFTKFILALICLVAGNGLMAQPQPEKDSIPFEKSDVKAAQKLLGLSFTKTEIDTMYAYLGRNLNGYQASRDTALSYNVVPAVQFNPLPNGIGLPVGKDQINWEPTTSVTRPKNNTDLAFLTISQLAELLKTKQITSTELTNFFLNRIRKYDPLIKATITITDSLALALAKQADEEIAAGNYKGPLHGIPFGVKDIIAVTGYKTTWGAAPYKDQYIDETATVVQKLIDAGGVLVAKLTSGALARGDVWFGGKTRNPWDTIQGASGSSAGSASATAAGLVPYSIGTETLGSIISPSSRCGATGLRPTFGQVSRAGVMSLSWSMDKIGPICRNAYDCAIVFDAIRGKDAADRSTVNVPFKIDFRNDIATLKIAYLKDVFEKDTSDAGKRARTAIKKLQSLGAELVPVQLPETFEYPMFDPILRAEAGAFFEQMVLSNGDDLMVEQHQRSRANSLRQAYFIPAVAYIQANRYRTILIQQMQELMKDYDVLIAPRSGTKQSLITNLTGHPAISIPTGFDKKNRPTSIVLISQLYREGPILELAHQYQKSTKFEDQHPPMFLK